MRQCNRSSDSLHKGESKGLYENEGCIDPAHDYDDVDQPYENEEWNHGDKDKSHLNTPHEYIHIEQPYENEHLKGKYKRSKIDPDHDVATQLRADERNNQNNGRSKENPPHEYGDVNWNKNPITSQYLTIPGAEQPYDTAITGYMNPISGEYSSLSGNKDEATTQMNLSLGNEAGCEPYQNEHLSTKNNNVDKKNSQEYEYVNQN